MLAELLVSTSCPLHARNNVFLFFILFYLPLFSPRSSSTALLSSTPTETTALEPSISNVVPYQGTQPMHMDSSPYAYPVRTTVTSPVSREVRSVLPQRTRLVAIRPSFALRGSRLVPHLTKVPGAGCGRKGSATCALSALSASSPTLQGVVQAVHPSRLKEGTIPTYSMTASTARRHGATHATPGRTSHETDELLSFVFATRRVACLVVARPSSTRRKYVRRLISNPHAARVRPVLNDGLGAAFVPVYSYARRVDFVRDASGVLGTYVPHREVIHSVNSLINECSVDGSQRIEDVAAKLSLAYSQRCESCTDDANNPCSSSSKQCLIQHYETNTVRR